MLRLQAGSKKEALPGALEIRSSGSGSQPLGTRFAVWMWRKRTRWEGGGGNSGSWRGGGVTMLCEKRGGGGAMFSAFAAEGASRLS